MQAASLGKPIVVHHMAALDSTDQSLYPWTYPPNALEAIRACLEAGAPFIEIDVTALRRGDYLLVHDPVLESETTGQGDVSAADADTVKRLHIKHNGHPTAYAPALLSEVVALFQEYGGTSRLQIDFKNVLPMRDDEPLRRLVALIKPLGERVLVSSGADWHLRALRRLDHQLDLGFDIGFYLDYRPHPVDPRLPPYREGAYGYHDDHILSLQPLLSAAAYLEERIDILYRQITEVSTWYVHYRLLARALADGFNLAAWLHLVGIKLDAWTMDADKPDAMAHLADLQASGVDQFTTNTPRALAALLEG
ncbi:MAG: glycerophosphodiester phosphodiesterase family protein [bacterium]|nr:glycerophosphodiester phosphodiesterase family protein [bacterium]